MDKLLLVDQNEKNIDLISQFLSTSDYGLYTASTGKIAIAKIKMLKPDLIIIDSDLPDISGFDVCKTIKSDPETKYCLVLLMISVETKDSILRSLHSGSDDYIIKNFDSTILLSKVKSLLRIKHLSDRITTQYSELKEKNELINLQLKTARKVQQSIIREIDARINKTHIISKYLPAIEIGGDFFDAKRLDNSHIGIILGDVSGHGISSALLTSMLGMMFNTLVYNYTNPDELLMAMNSQFYNIFEGSDNQMFACVFYAIIDVSKNTILYSNAGQSFPMYLKSSNSTARELQLGGIPIGVMDNTTYENALLSYESGDYLFLHTDGLSDLFYKDNPEEFTKKLKETLIKATETHPEALPEIIDSVLDQFYDVNLPNKYETDDVSIILCKL